MKRYCLALLALALAVTPALAQQAPDMKTYTSSSEVQDLIAKAKEQPAKPLIIQPILSLAPYRASLEYRAGSPAPAAVHKTDAELMYVIDGDSVLRPVLFRDGSRVEIHAATAALALNSAITMLEERFGAITEPAHGCAEPRVPPRVTDPYLLTD